MERMEREEIQHGGYNIARLGFVLNAAVAFAAARTEAGIDAGFPEHGGRSTWAFDAAEALWREACERFPEEEG